MARTFFTREQVLAIAKDQAIHAVTIRYMGQKGDIRYPWNQFDRIAWERVVRCRLDWKEPRIHMIDGEECKRPGFRIRPLVVSKDN